MRTCVAPVSGDRCRAAGRRDASVASGTPRPRRNRATLATGDSFEASVRALPPAGTWMRARWASKVTGTSGGDAEQARKKNAAVTPRNARIFASW
jgi:hypothetical protein